MFGVISLHDLLDAVNQHLFCPALAGILRLGEGFHLTASCKIQVMTIIVPGVEFHLNFISIYLFAVKYLFYFATVQTVGNIGIVRIWS